MGAENVALMEPVLLVTAAICLLLFVSLVFEVMPAHILMFLALTGLMLAGVVPAESAFAGFSNREMLTVAILYIVAAGFHSGGLSAKISEVTFGKVVSGRVALARMMTIVTGASTFFNNTPIVAIWAPAVLGWCRSKNIPPSKLMLPLSYAAIFGGLCSLIGTSTNLVVSGLMERNQMNGMSFFEIGLIGFPAALIGIVYMMTLGYRWLPERKGPLDEAGAHANDILIEVCLGAGSQLAGKTIEAVRLRNLPGLFLAKIVRNRTVIAPVSSTEALQEEDRLFFSGDMETVGYVLKITGDESCVNREATELGVQLVEAVLPAESDFIGDTLKNIRFRSRFDGAVVAIYRDGRKLSGKLGEQILQAGDTMLLLAGPDFEKNLAETSDLLVVSDGQTTDASHNMVPGWKRALPFMILAALVFSVVAGMVSMFQAAAAAAAITLLSRLIKPQDALKHIEWNVLIVIACSFGIAIAMERSGLAALIGRTVVGLIGGYGPQAGLFATLTATCLITEFLTNNAAAALMFPLAVSVAQNFGVDPRPFAIAVAIGASAGFAMPFGYQTHLMVYGPGGYRFQDFLRVGIPLDILYIIMGTVMIPLIWRF